MRAKVKMRKPLFSRNASVGSPAKMRMNANRSPDGCYLFDDGSFGRISTGDFDPGYWEEEGLDPKDLRVNGRNPIGEMYIDRWTRDGEFVQGGCYLYYSERLADYCVRNREPLPMREIPEAVVDAFEEGDEEELRRLEKEVPELKGVHI